jgi:hypothetical protein
MAFLYEKHSVTDDELAEIRAGVEEEAQDEISMTSVLFLNILDRLEAERAAAADVKVEVEQLRVQLAGTLTAAEGNGIRDAAAKVGDFGWSVAYETVRQLRLKYETQAAMLKTRPARAIAIFGRRDQGGHFWHRPDGGGKLYDLKSLLPTVPATISGIDGADGLLPRASSAQGRAKLSVIRENDKTWTVLNWHDYVADSRPGSHSAVLVFGEATNEEMLALAIAQFGAERAGKIEIVEEAR